MSDLQNPATEQEAATVSSDGGWPIRVGGVYPCTENEALTARVTGIYGDTIHYHWYGSVRRGSHYSCAAWVFRKNYFPEDQSPIPALVEALKGLLSELSESGIETPFGSPLMHAVLKANTALKLAEQGVTK